MSLEVTRQIADWLSGTLKDATGAPQGVNQFLEMLPRDSKDGKPKAIKNVYDNTRDNLMARGDIPLDRPILLVSPFTPITEDGEVQTLDRNGEVTIAIRCATGNEDSAEDTTYNWYLLRAIVRSLFEFLHNKNADPVWTRNGVTILACRKIIAGPVKPDNRSGRITSAVLATFAIRDYSPGY